MRRFGLSLGLLLTLAAPALADLAGTARVGTRPTQYAVVWLEAPGSRHAAKSKVTLDQRNLTFLPHVLAVRVGTTVEFPNNDKVFLVIGPWHHGQMIGKGSSLGAVKFGSDTARYFRQRILRPFLDQHLKDGAPKADIAPVTAFETGTNAWRRFSAWPPKAEGDTAIRTTPLYLRAGLKLSLKAPAAGEANPTSRPSSLMVPSSGATTPDMILMRVDLPAPFSPSMAWILPALTVSSALSSARTPP